MKEIWFLYEKHIVEYSHGSYIHVDEFRGIRVNIRNDEIDSNGRRGSKELVTMRIMQREVHSYREYNENIIKS
jgi:hypothetical protein